jgi:SAM-dependent methyltransferase
MHDQAKNFTIHIKNSFPGFFQNKKVLDVGSGDINGNNRFLFENCSYEGNDVYAARNVTVVSKTTALTFEDESFDTICSTECFEHDPEYEQSFQKIVKMLKPGGLFFFTCASTGRAEHGTRRTSPQDSYGTIGNIEGWTDYYKNLTFQELDAAINVKNTFSSYAAWYCPETKDLYFYGIKNGGNIEYSPINYIQNSCVKTA